jgi:two-component system, OmpR family, phosphate regulon sensor histidine kinase PhoR
MTTEVVVTLADVIQRDQEVLLLQWREQVRALPSARDLDVPTLNDHIPGHLGELVLALRSKSVETIAEALLDGSPPAHGLQRLKEGFDLEEVVAEYNILRGCLHDLATGHGLSLQGAPFHILNRVLDGAIGTAVQTYATQRAVEVQQRREEYLAFVMHDLRTPLSAISLAANVLERTLRPGENHAETSRMFNALRRNVRQLETLVTKVMEENTNLKTEMGVKLERRHLHLWPLVEALIHDVHPIAGTSSTKLVNEVPDDLTIFADALLLRRILQNLIANAIGYTPQGTIVIGAENRSSDGSAVCWVSDDGAGIPAGMVDKVFEKFESDPQKETGSGLGLAIVKTFVEGHGGIITVDSREGYGTTFRFTLPA